MLRLLFLPLLLLLLLLLRLEFCCDIWLFFCFLLASSFFHFTDSFPTLNFLILFSFSSKGVFPLIYMYLSLSQLLLFLMYLSLSPHGHVFTNSCVSLSHLQYERSGQSKHGKWCERMNKVSNLVTCFKFNCLCVDARPQRRRTQ